MYNIPEDLLGNLITLGIVIFVVENNVSQETEYNESFCRLRGHVGREGPRKREGEEDGGEEEEVPPSSSGMIV